MNIPRENKNVNTMQGIVKMCDFSVFFFSLMRENGLLEYLLNILEQVLYSLCNKTQAVKIFYIQTRSDRTLYLETKF
jgi:Mg2+/citrate symporter